MSLNLILFGVMIVLAFALRLHLGQVMAFPGDCEEWSLGLTPTREQAVAFETTAWVLGGLFGVLAMNVLGGWLSGTAKRMDVIFGAINVAVFALIAAHAAINWAYTTPTHPVGAAINSVTAKFFRPRAVWFDERERVSAPPYVGWYPGWTAVSDTESVNEELGLTASRVAFRSCFSPEAQSLLYRQQFGEAPPVENFGETYAEEIIVYDSGGRIVFTGWQYFLDHFTRARRMMREARENPADMTEDEFWTAMIDAEIAGRRQPRTNPMDEISIEDVLAIVEESWPEDGEP